MALYLTEEDVAAVLTTDIALEEVEKGFVHLAEGAAFNFPRNRLPNGRGAFNFMAATAHELGVMGMKTYGVGPGRSRFYVHLYDAATTELVALIEANGMGKVRTVGRQRHRHEVHVPRRRIHGRHDRLRLPGQHPARSRVQGQRYHEREDLLPHP